MAARSITERSISFANTIEVVGDLRASTHHQARWLLLLVGELCIWTYGITAYNKYIAIYCHFYNVSIKLSRPAVFEGKETKSLLT